MSHFSGKKFAGVIVSSVILLAGFVSYASTVQEQMRQVLEANWPTDSSIEKSGQLAIKLDTAVALKNICVVGDSLEFQVSEVPEFSAFTLDNGTKLVISLKDTVSVIDQLPKLSTPMFPILAACNVSLDSVVPEVLSQVSIEFTEPVGFYEIKDNGETVLVIQSKADTLASKMAGLVSKDKYLNLKFKAENTGDSGNPVLKLAKSNSLNIEDVTLQFKSIIPEKNEHATGLENKTIASVETAKIDFLNFNIAYDAASKKDNPNDDDSLFDGVPDVPNERRMLRPAEEADKEAAEERANTPETVEAEPADAPGVEPSNDNQTDEEPVEPPMPRIEIAPVTSGANTDINSKINELNASADGNNDAVVSVNASPSVPAKASISMDTTKPRFVGDPLNQLVNVDFREMDLSNVVALLSHKAGINVIAGTDLVGVVTANLRNVTLKRAMEEALRMNGLGMVEDGGIYRIVTLREVHITDRKQEIVKIDNAVAKEIAGILQEMVKGSLEAPFINISSNEQKNVIILSGPENRIDELISLARQLDVAEPKLQTMTELFKLNYADPEDVAKAISQQLSSLGKVGVDARARQLVVTDEPLILDHLREIIKAMDQSVKQVIIEAMIVDITLEDEASTGVQWLLSSVRSQNQRGENIGSLQELGLNTDLSIQNVASVLNFGVLSDNINWSGIIQAEVRNSNGRLHSNPVVVTMENKPARIAIAQEVPFIEFKNTDQGGQATNTEFKKIGTILEVTPRVTHDNDILVTVYVKESDTRGELNGVPIEDIREAESELRTANGQTIFIGGLRKNDHDSSIRKVPILGDVPVFNVLFRQNTRTEEINELMVFMTNTVLEEKLPELDKYQEMKYTGAMETKLEVNAQRSFLHDMIYPNEISDPAWKFRRSE